LGMAFLWIPYRNTGVISPGGQIYNVVIEPYGFKSLNFTLGVNVSIIVTLDTELPSNASPEAVSTGEGCIDIKIADRMNYDKWLQNENISTFLSVDGVHIDSYVFHTDSGGTYYLILSNVGRCSGKIVTVELQDTSAKIESVGGQQFQFAGLGSLSLGVLMATYGFAKEKIPKNI